MLFQKVCLVFGKLREVDRALIPCYFKKLIIIYIYKLYGYYDITILPQT